LAIAAIVLIVFLFGALIAGLFASLMTFLTGILAAFIGEALAALVVSFLVEAVGAYFVASAVKSLGTNIYRAFFSDEEMSDKERGDIVGKGIFDVGISSFGYLEGRKDVFWRL
jgi:uncharacterized membrane protein YoaK (UPF0700 family)